jgi:hypothetical protein
MRLAHMHFCASRNGYNCWPRDGVVADFQHRGRKDFSVLLGVGRAAVRRHGRRRRHDDGTSSRSSPDLGRHDPRVSERHTTDRGGRACGKLPAALRCAKLASVLSDGMGSALS